MNNDTRWKQRFNNFENAFQTFCRVMERYDKNKQDELAKMALVQCFEFSLELSWKTLKDYLENAGYPIIQTPKETIRLAFQANIISDGQNWMEALEKRNRTSHTYNLEVLNDTVAFIDEKFYQMIQRLNKELKKYL